jgi:hypothetical protein
MHISVNIDGTIGYISTYRDDSRGGLDLYSVKFSDVETKKSVVLGKIITYVPVDYNEYQKFNIYRHKGKNLKVPVEFSVLNNEMMFVKHEKELLKPKFKYVATYILNIDGQEKEFEFNGLPQNYTDYTLVDVKLKEIVNSQPVNVPPGQTFATRVVKTSFLDVYDKRNELVGTYSSNPNSGSFVLILEPGIYEVIYFADFYKEAAAKIEVFGNSGFEPIIHKDFKIEFDGDPEAVYYRELLKEESED